MGKSLQILAVLASFLLFVALGTAKSTEITINNTAIAASGVAVSEDGGNSSAVAVAGVSSSITIETTKNKKKCAANERFVMCPEKICEPQVCSHVGYPQCSSHEKKHDHKKEDKVNEEKSHETGKKDEQCSGPPACICMVNYVRNHGGVCIPAKECPSCGGDKNATHGCGINCGRRCSNYDKGSAVCTETCYENSCDCKKDYVFDDYTGRCVKPKDCSLKHPTKPERTTGTPDKGEDKEDNKDNQETDKTTSESSEEPGSKTTGESEAKTTTQTSSSNEHPDSSTDKSEEPAEESGSKATKEEETEHEMTTKKSPETKEPESTSKSEEEEHTSKGTEKPVEESESEATKEEETEHEMTTKKSPETKEPESTSKSGEEEHTSKGTEKPLEESESEATKAGDTEDEMTTKKSPESTHTSKETEESESTPKSGEEEHTSEGTEKPIEESESEVTKAEETEHEMTTKKSPETTHKHKKTKKPKSTTKSREEEHTSKGTEKPTEESGSKATKAEETEHKMTTKKSPETTHSHKKTKKPKTTTKSRESEESEESEENEHKKTKKPKSTTKSGETEKSETTKAEKNKHEMTTKKSSETTHSDKKTKKPKTTTKSGESEESETTKAEENEHEMTTKKSSETTEKHKKTKKPESTTKSGEEEQTSQETEESEKTTEETSDMTTTDDSENATTESSMATSTKPKGSKYCKGKHEHYYRCASKCPQKTCADYLNGVKCKSHGKHHKCKSECRCLAAFYRSDDGRCLTKKECKKEAKSTSEEMGSTGTDSENQEMSTTPDPMCVDKAYELFITGNLVYTTKVLLELSLNDPGNNVIVGGASILFLLGQIVVDSKGTVNTEIMKVLNLKKKKQVLCLLPEISANLTTTYHDIHYDLFCKIYADESHALSQEFIKSTTLIFGTRPENIKMKSLKGAKKINSDVEKNTNKQFKDFVEPRLLRSLESLVLVDAEHFQGKWEKQFSPLETTVKDFYTQGRIDKIDFMHQRGNFFYADVPKLSAKILQMKYKGGIFGLTIFLPYTVDGIKEVTEKLQNAKDVLAALNSLKLENVDVYMPKITISVANRLKGPSELAKLKEIFNNETTDLIQIGSAKPPYVSEILQKIDYHVDEYGMGKKLDVHFSQEETPHSKLLPKITYKVDHAFCFMITYRSVLPLQAGVFIHL